MSAATLTSKGQVTIPVDVRRRLGLSAGDQVEFVETREGEFAIKPVIDDVRSLKGLLRKQRHPVSLEDMKATIRARGAGR
ncbi:MAG TPA: AbrB/MazE/SpoVT family DNA-binding domain-containing protein [Burkholderiales bacterium]